MLLFSECIFMHFKHFYTNDNCFVQNIMLYGSKYKYCKIIFERLRMKVNKCQIPNRYSAETAIITETRAFL